MSIEITKSIPFRIGGRPQIMAAVGTFTWHPSDPLVVKAVFQWSTEEPGADWGFSRELLVEGLDAILNVGKGDVRVRSDAYQYVFTLNSPDGKAQIFMARAAMFDFLAETTAALPLDSEEEEHRMDAWMDLALAEILKESE